MFDPLTPAPLPAASGERVVALGDRVRGNLVYNKQLGISTLSLRVLIYSNNKKIACQAI